MANETRFIRDNAHLYGSFSELVATAVKLGYDRKYLYNSYSDIMKGKTPVSFGISEVKTTTTIGMTESELREKYDIKQIASKAANNLQRGIYLSESDFLRHAGIVRSGYRQVLDHIDFSHFKGRAGGITYWSHPESIQKMKNEGVLT